MGFLVKSSGVGCDCKDCRECEIFNVAVKVLSLLKFINNKEHIKRVYQL